MKFKNLLILILLIFLMSTVFSTHCWKITVGDVNPSEEWTAPEKILLKSPIMYGDLNITDVVLPGTIVTFSNFGEYHFHCNNGDNRYKQRYFVYKLQNIFNKSNSTTNKAILSTINLPYCRVDAAGNILGDSSDQIGVGNGDSISYTFGLDQLGPQSYALHVDERPIPGQAVGSLRTVANYTDNILVAGFPSLLVLGPADAKTSFYEKDGEYQRDVIFTIHKKHPLDINVLNYELTCEGNGIKECTIENNGGYKLVEDNDTVMIFGKVVIDKDKLPTKVFAKLDVNFTVPDLMDYNAYNRIYSTHSALQTIEVGLLDKQSFQVRIVSDVDTTNCASADGTVGRTGEDIAPRINLDFGNDGIVDLNECDDSNPDWVYCSQPEFITEISKKIADIVRLKDDVVTARGASNQTLVDSLENEIADLANFNINVRDIDVSTEKLTDALDILETRLMVSPSDIGLNNYSGTPVNFGTGQPQAYLLKELFTGNNKLKFTILNGDLTEDLLVAGKYEGKLTISSVNDDFELFIDGNLNPAINITFDFGKHYEPNFDWFFYRQESDIILENIIPNTPDFYQANVDNRGQLFKFEQNDNDLNVKASSFWSIWATPLIAKIEVDNNQITNQFNITGQDVTSLKSDEPFTYWTGFATNKGEGCEDISAIKEDNSLVYQVPDELNSFTNSQVNQTVSILDYAGLTANDGIEYLQTVLYLPNPADRDITQLTIDGNIELYTLSESCSDQNCSVDLIPNDSQYKISTMQELFDGIKSSTVCVSAERKTITTTWKMFLNDASILEDLNVMKNSISDATICGN